MFHPISTPSITEAFLTPPQIPSPDRTSTITSSSTTMGQYWWGKMGEHIFDASPNRLSNPLLRPTIPQFAPGRFSTYRTNDPPLLKLPNELLLQIFEAQLTYSDIFRLAICSPRLWAVGRSRLIAKLLNRSAPGADTPLIAVGDYCEPDDIPPAMKGLKDPWNLAARGPIKDGDKVLPYLAEGEHYFKMVSKTPFMPRCAADIMYRFVPEKSLHLEGRYKIERTTIAQWSQDEATYQMFVADLLPLQTLTQYLPASFRVDVAVFANPLQLYPDSRYYILRNLTTKEFVAFADINDNPRDTLLKNKGMSFGHVLLRRICWSSDNSMAIYNAPEDMHRGVWAGHCFDVVMGEEAAKEGFKDVGKEVRADLERLWQGEYDGKDWEAHYRDFSYGSSPDLMLGGYIYTR
ncbi:hypothetical protein K440DRAFT_664940 [Wilcoxina mikolae CBS 423.85]|nr:hypothetical protein K440DRAFT_664940 [Wilcoxina mikolae CBS 423.85]